MKYIIRLFILAKPWTKYLVASTVALFLIASINLYIPYVSKQIIEIMETGNYNNSVRKDVILSLILEGLIVNVLFFV